MRLPAVWPDRLAVAAHKHLRSPIHQETTSAFLPVVIGVVAPAKRGIHQVRRTEPSGQSELGQNPTSQAFRDYFQVARHSG